eukprot:354043-Chlamydomonas_euryale.AAC.2
MARTLAAHGAEVSAHGVRTWGRTRGTHSAHLPAHGHDGSAAKERRHLTLELAGCDDCGHQRRNRRRELGLVVREDAFQLRTRDLAECQA